MKKLIFVPVIHSEIDMGSMKGALKEEFIQKYGLARWENHVSSIHEMWTGIRKRIFDLKLDYQKVHVYQDGLPVCGKEHQIVRDVAQQGSENYKIILDLIEKGAKLEGTEDASLLIREYNYLKKISKPEPSAEKEEAVRDYEKEADEILLDRDKFIAERIKDTLLIEEVGILFIGLKHKVDELLSDDIAVTYLIHRLPFKAGEDMVVNISDEKF